MERKKTLPKDFNVKDDTPGTRAYEYSHLKLDPKQVKDDSELLFIVDNPKKPDVLYVFKDHSGITYER